MKKYVVFSESKRNVEYQLSISNKIIDAEPANVIVNIIQSWLTKINVAFNGIRLIGDNTDISISLCTSNEKQYYPEIVKDKYNIKINIVTYNRNYDIREV